MQVIHFSLGADGDLNFVLLLSEMMQLGRQLELALDEKVTAVTAALRHQ